MFTPFRLRDMVVENRVVVSPMDQYSAVDGVPGDWHFVHLGSRAVGGAGLVYVEMTCPSPEARISPGRHRAVERSAARRLQAHRRFLPRQFEGEDVHAARPFRPQGLDAARLGAHGLSARERQLAGGLGFADPVLRGNLAGAASSSTGRRWRRSSAISRNPRATPTRPASTCSSCTWRTATCWRASSRRSPISARTSTAAASRTACASRWRSSLPAERSGRRASRCRCASRPPTGRRAGCRART